MKYANTVPCHKGWKDNNHNWDGRCCCNCKFQQTLVGHPWNKTFGKGRVTQALAYACTMPEFFPSITIMEANEWVEGEDGVLEGEHHSMCECWTERDRKYSENDKYTVISVTEKEVDAVS